MQFYVNTLDTADLSLSVVCVIEGLRCHLHAGYISSSNMYVQTTRPLGGTVNIASLAIPPCVNVSLSLFVHGTFN